MPRTALLCVLFLLIATVSAWPQDSPQSPTQEAGRWSLTQRNGTWWFVTPGGEPFYSKGVDVLSGRTTSAKAATWQAFDWRNHFPSEEAWRAEAEGRVAAWGFNTRGGWSDDSRQFSLPLTVELDLGRLAQLHWFDPFDPGAENATLRIARDLTAPYRGDPRLLGYFTDNEVGWWNTALFSYYLQYGIENHTKQVLWDLLHTRYQGDWKRLCRDFVPSRYVRGFEDLKLAGGVLKLKPDGQGMALVWTTRGVRFICR